MLIKVITINLVLHIKASIITLCLIMLIIVIILISVLLC